MASILVWILVFNLIRTTYERDCNEMRNLSFQCRFKHVNTTLNLECENEIPEGNITTTTYLLLEAEREEEREPLRSFDNFFETNFTSNSTLYWCDGILRSIIHIDPSVKEQCENYTHCIYQVSTFLRASNVKSVELKGISTQSGAIQNISRFFPSLEELRIYRTPSYNLSKIRIKNFENLKSLLLTENNIRGLPEDLFSESNSLKRLNLAKNSISQIYENTFGYLPSLKTLNLSVNLIHFIAKKAFSNAPDLKQLYLMSNALTELDEELFLVQNRLEVLDLSKNPIGRLPEKIFGNLRRLKVFRCNGCRLDSIPENLFVNSKRITELHLSKNRLKSLSSKTFQDQTSLKTVDFSNNKLIEIPEFQMTSLRFVNLANNSIFSIGPNLTADSPDLLFLDLSFNNIRTLLDSDVKSFHDLEILDLRSNHISAVNLGVKIDYVRIRKLDLSNNSIQQQFTIKWGKLRILELFKADNNEIEYLDLPQCIDSVKQTITFSFQNNKIKRVGLESLLEDERRANAGDRTMSGCYFNGMPKNFLDLSGNPFTCDCELYPFYEYLTKSNGRKLDTILNKETLQCSTPDVLGAASIMSVPGYMFTCPVEVKCPPPCRCGLRGRDGRIFINCTGQGLESVPRHPPPEATVLYMNDNAMRDLDSLNGPDWRNLTELYADHNHLTSLGNWTLPDPLEYLSLRGNELKTLPDRVMFRLASNSSDFQRLFFGGNDRRCNCGSKPLKNFLLEHADLVPDRDDVICEVDDDNGTTFLPLHVVPDNVLCAIFPKITSDVVLVSLCGSLAVLVGLVLLYYKQRPLVLSFFYTRCGWFGVGDDDDDDERVFDAFVAYSSCDRDIVMRLLQELEEKEPHFRLCVHERDWLPGRFIVDNITWSVQSSRRTIVVLSDAFVASPWFRLELRAAVFKASEDGRNRLVVVLADPATRLDGIDVDLRHLVTKRTYLVWGERWFWQKLRYAMPRRSCREDATSKSESEIRLVEASAC